MLGINNIPFYLRNHFFQLLDNCGCCCVQWNTTKRRKYVSISKLKFKKTLQSRKKIKIIEMRTPPAPIFPFCILLKNFPSFTILSRALAMLHGLTCFYSSSTLDFRKYVSNGGSHYFCLSKWSLSEVQPHPTWEQLSENDSCFEVRFSWIFSYEISYECYLLIRWGKVQEEFCSMWPVNPFTSPNIFTPFGASWPDQEQHQPVFDFSKFSDHFSQSVLCPITFESSKDQ